MSAVYTSEAFRELFSQQFNAVMEYVAQNPGKSVDAIATALTIPYEVAYAICSESALIILPNASGELQFGPSHGHNKT